MNARHVGIAAALAIISGFAMTAFAQESPAKPATPAVPAKASSESKPKPEFPKIKKKNLFATNDLRGQEAPKIEFGTWLNKKPETKDKVILIDFWATWCGPCRKLIPELAEWQEKFKDDLVVIGLSDEKPAKVLEFFKKDKMKYAMAVDQNGKTKKALGISGIPHVLIIGTDNVVRWQGFPGSNEDTLTEDVLKKIIDADKARRASADAKKPERQTSKDQKRSSESSTKSDKKSASDSSSDSKSESNSDSQSDSQSESKSESKTDSNSDAGKNPK
jgi:thiol-disulfide isomerase/thioredoxin